MPISFVSCRMLQNPGSGIIAYVINSWSACLKLHSASEDSVEINFGPLWAPEKSLQTLNPPSNHCRYFKAGGPVFVCIDGEDYPWGGTRKPYTLMCNNMMEPPNCTVRLSFNPYPLLGFVFAVWPCLPPQSSGLQHSRIFLKANRAIKDSYTPSSSLAQACQGVPRYGHGSRSDVCNNFFFVIFLHFWRSTWRVTLGLLNLPEMLETNQAIRLA